MNLKLFLMTISLFCLASLCSAQPVPVNLSALNGIWKLNQPECEQGKGIPDKIIVNPESKQIDFYWEERQVALKDFSLSGDFVEGYRLTENKLSVVVSAGEVYGYVWSLTSGGLLALQYHLTYWEGNQVISKDCNYYYQRIENQ
jgi:hypothetical protein